MWHERLVLLLAFVLLKPFPIQAMLAGALVLAGFAAPRLFAGISGASNGLGRLADVPLSIAMAGLLSGFVLVRSGVTYVGPSWIDTIAFRHIGSWSASVWADEETWKAWEALAGKQGDFPLLAVYKPLPAPLAVAVSRKYNTHPFAYTVSGKSQFAPLPAHTYLDLESWREAQDRQEIRNIIFDRLEGGRPIDDTWVGKVTIGGEQVPHSINDTLSGFLRKRRVRILVPAELEALFLADAGRERVGAHMLISFDR
jgi:hypothetical protein